MSCLITTMTENTKKRAPRRKSIYIDLMAHVVLTLTLACFFYARTGRLTWFFLCIVGGILIDIDHLVDHFSFFGARFKIKDFIRQESFRSGKAYVPFHSWELAGLLWLSSFWIAWMIPVATGITGHLVIDQVVHREDPFFYFLIHRWRCRFQCVKLTDNGGNNGTKES